MESMLYLPTLRVTINLQEVLSIHWRESSVEIVMSRGNNFVLNSRSGDTDLLRSAVGVKNSPPPYEPLKKAGANIVKEVIFDD